MDHVPPPERRRLITVGVLLGIFLAGIDGTLVSTAMPTVVQELHGFAVYGWVFAAYMLLAAVTIPLFGKLADAYDPRTLFLAGVTFFVAGSVLCGLSQTMVQLVVFRGLQGIGAGAMFAIPYTILGHIHPPQARGRAIGYGSFMWGISSVLGPLFGYLIVANVSWRYAFFVNVPVGAAAFLLVHRALPPSEDHQLEHLDYAGATALVVGATALILAAQDPGGLPSFLTVPVLAVLAVAALALFAVLELRVRDPLLHPDLFRDRVFTTTNLAAFLSSFLIFAVISYVPLFVQAIHGGPLAAALAILPLSLGWSGASMISGRIVHRHDERHLVLLGSVVLLLGSIPGSLWAATTPLPLLMLNILVLGAGTGILVPPLLTRIQNHVGRERLGVATASQQFFRNLGGTLGVGVLGGVMNLAMRNALAGLPGITSLGDLERSLATGHPPAGVAAALATGVSTMFLGAAVVAVILLGAAFLIPAHESAEAEAAAGWQKDGGAPPASE